LSTRGIRRDTTGNVSSRSGASSAGEEFFMAQQAVLSMTDIARASVLAYNDKDWKAARTALAPNCVYDEVATRRKAHGADDILAVWQGWAKALPDSKATIHSELVTGNTVVLELTWHGTHSGPLQTPRGELAPTGKKMELRACQVIEVSGEKVKMVRHYFDMATLLGQLGASL
jgi:steroid delta-isomerase-like uncharacterized protein